MSKLTVDECKRIIMQGRKQLTKELREAAFSIQGNLGRCLYRRKHLDEMRKVSDLLFEAADTIESLRDRLQELQGVGGESRYSELFGTPERAANMLALGCMGASENVCDSCVFRECDGKLRRCGSIHSIATQMLEWLRSDA